MKENKIKGRKMKQKLISLIALLAVGALLTGCLAPSEEEIEEREPVKGVDYQIEPAEPGWNWYINKEFGFKIKYPTDWKNFEAYREASLGGFLIDDSVEDGFFDVRVMPLKELEKFIGKTEMPLSITRKVVEARAAVEADLEIVEITNLTLAGAPATKIKYTFYHKHPDTGEKIEGEMKAMEISLIKDKYLYEFSYDCAESKTFDKYSNTIDKMINSFEFI
jgi:hypothetical protein